MALTDLQSRLLNYCEQVYLLEGFLPTFERAKIAYPELTQAYWQDFFRRPEIKKAFNDRGIAETHKGALTEQQLFCVNTLLDFTDNRSKSRKLSDLGISTQKYQTWLKDPGFQSYLQARAEKMLGDNMQEAHIALMNALRGGDVSAIKLFYEITGRHVPKTNGENALNITILIMKILEVIQTFVRDEAVLNQIAEGIMALASDGSAPVGGVGKVLDLPITAMPMELEAPPSALSEESLGFAL